MNHTETIIEIDNVCFAYNHDEVIKDVSLQVHRGDYVGIIGPNGGGKSTLLKLMLGILKTKDGSVKLFGTDIHDFKDWSKIGYVSQKSHIEMNLPVTVEELVLMGRYGKLGLFHFPSKNNSEKAHHALAQVEMLEYKNRQISDLSGGQQQRVLIARALAGNPEVIFLDEPTVGVDVRTQKQFYELLRKLNQKLNLTLVLVTHELDIVAHEATEAGYINRTLEYFGDPKELLTGKYFHHLIGKEDLHH